MRPIDADKLLIALPSPEMYVTKKLIEEAPTIDAEPVRHGRWIKLDRDIAVCSECGRHENALLVDSYPYCHCGAKMDGGVEND